MSFQASQSEVPRPEAGRRLFTQLLDECARRGASDLHITPGSPPTARIEGRLVPLGEAAWGADATEAFCREICGERQWAELQEIGTTDFGVSHDSGDRFRISVFKQRRGVGAVLRRVSSEFMTFEEIGLPPVTMSLLEKSRGLILVTGPTGAGKSTTLATMVDWINENFERHIVTIEDPVEFTHVGKRGLITQREVGADVPTFPEAMRRVLRQDPDVILLGEMRDLATITAAVSAAETGHLVLGTLHTTGAANTMSRIIDAFPAEQQAQIRVQLAMSLAAVISQVLIPGIDENTRVAGLEVMITTPAISNLIRNNEVNRIPDVIQTSGERGMFTLDDHLAKLVRESRITAETALAFALDPAMLERRL